MKKIIPILLLLFVSIVLHWGCSKGTKIAQETSFIANDARTFFDNNSRVSEKKKAKYYLTPLWKDATLTTYNEITKFLIVPTKTGETKPLKDGSKFFRFVVFTFLKEKVIAGRVIEVIGQKSFVNEHLETIIKRRYLDNIEGFTGKIVEYDINYQVQFGGLQYKNGVLDKAASVRLISGNNVPLNDASNARVVSTQALQSSEGWCLTTYIITTYPNGHQEYEIIDVDCVFYNDDPPPGSGGTAGSDEGEAGSNVPGDRLCRGSLHFQKPSDNSMWTTNIMGLKLEDGVDSNSFNAYVHLPNGITDAAMHADIISPGLPIPSGTSAAEYIASDPIFMTLFPSGDIQIKYETTGTHWYFTEYAARYITTWALNLAGAAVAMLPGSAMPGNIEAQNLVRNMAQSFIKCVMPGAIVRKALDPSTTTSRALYSPACQNVGN